MDKKKKKKVDDVWYILVFEIFARKYFEISENDFIQLPFSNEDFLKKRKAQFLTEEKNNYNWNNVAQITHFFLLENFVLLFLITLL